MGMHGKTDKKRCENDKLSYSVQSKELIFLRNLEQSKNNKGRTQQHSTHPSYTPGRSWIVPYKAY